jgi:hypothetical protein
MRRFRSFLMMALALVAPLGRADEPKEWAMNATIIEACTCPMFCQCFFNEKVAGHHDHATGQMKHYCKGNLAFKITAPPISAGPSSGWPAIWASGSPTAWSGAW